VVIAAGFANDPEFFGQIDRHVGVPTLREIIRSFELAEAVNACLGPSRSVCGTTPQVPAAAAPPGSITPAA
jgi:hypothetical protein